MPDCCCAVLAGVLAGGAEAAAAVAPAGRAACRCCHMLAMPDPPHPPHHPLLQYSREPVMAGLLAGAKPLGAAEN